MPGAGGGATSGTAGIAIFGGGGGGGAAAGGVAAGVFGANVGAGALDFCVDGFGAFGTATLGADVFAGFTGLVACFLRVTGFGRVGADIFGGDGATTGAGGTILGGGVTVGTAGLAICVRRFVILGAFRFRVVAFVVPRAARNVSGAMNRDFGIAAGGCFNGGRFTLRRTGFGNGVVRTAGDLVDGPDGVFRISRVCDGGAVRGVPGAG